MVGVCGVDHARFHSAAGGRDGLVLSLPIVEGPGGPHSGDPHGAQARGVLLRRARSCLPTMHHPSLHSLHNPSLPLSRLTHTHPAYSSLRHPSNVPNLSGTFTISNLGMFGVSSFVSILPPNQVTCSSILLISGRGRGWDIGAGFGT